MTDLIRAAGADLERISPESQDFPSWHLHMPLEASDQQQSQLYWLAGANAMNPSRSLANGKSPLWRVEAPVPAAVP